MNNYSIDASVYAYPFQGNSLDIKEIEDYNNTICNFNKLVDNSQFNIKYFLFEKDIKLILYNEKYDFSKQNISHLNALLVKNNSTIKIIGTQNEFKKTITILAVRLGLYKTFNTNNNNQGGDFTKYIIFEKWFKIKDVSFRSPEPQLSDSLSKIIEDEKLRDNSIKNIAIIAALNKNVYKNNEIHKIIFGNNVALKNIKITAHLDVVMKQYSFIDKNSGKNCIKDFKIKNFPDTNMIELNSQNVEISTLDTMAYKNNCISSWQDVITTPFNHITFAPEVEVGIKQYIDKIMAIQKEGNKNSIKKWKNGIKDVLYANLKALDNFLDVIDGSEIMNKPGDHYYDDCKPNCKFFAKCGAHIRLFGVDCADERKIHKADKYVRGDRTRDNKQGGKSTFWIHLRPRIKKCWDSNWFLSMRIHYKWVEANKKIEIGWIGRHLYLPCSDLSNCKRTECPLNPNCPNPPRDPSLNELENYLKQYPENPLVPEKPGIR
jgi:hypothetical protein